MRRFRRADGERGAVAVIVAIVLALALLPAVALGTGAYARSTTGAELNRASDTGALAGAAEIPLGNLTFVDNYLDQITGTGVGATLQQLGLDDPALPDPLGDACTTAVNDATNNDNLAHAYASTPTCDAKYIADDGPLAQVQNCVNNLTGSALNNLLNLLGGLLGGLGLGGLSPTQLVSSLSAALPALLDPGVKVTMTWNVKAPFDQVMGDADGHQQSSTSYARRRFKNVLVAPVVSLPGANGTININPTLQNVTSVVFQTLTQLEGVLGNLTSLLPGLSSCITALQDLQGDLSDLLSPPDNGPSLTQILDDAVSSNTPVLTLITGTSIPFLDLVPVCVQDLNGQYIAHLTSFAGCIIDAPGGFRASLRNS